MTRGEIWWVDFGLAFGSMTMGRRPALIVQNDNFNASTVDKECLVEKVSKLSPSTMLEISHALSDFLAL